MEARGYRSYVVRTWTRGAVDGAAQRVVIEEVQTGRQIELRGDEAAEIDARISTALGSTARAVSREKGQEDGMILVVGATGDLGGKIARGLVERGRDVRILVRPASPYRPRVDLGWRPALGDL